MKVNCGLAMLVLAIGSGCGNDDSNPVKSDQELLVGTWVGESGSSITFRADGTFVDSDEATGSWSVVGNALTLSYGDYESGIVVLNFVTETELSVTSSDGEVHVSTKQNQATDATSATSAPGDGDASINLNRELLVGTWIDGHGNSITYRADGTFIDSEEDEGTWSLVGDQLTLIYDDESYDSEISTVSSITETELSLIDEDNVLDEEMTYVYTRRT